MSNCGKEKQKSLQVRCTLMALELAFSHLFVPPPPPFRSGLLNSLMTEL